MKMRGRNRVRERKRVGQRGRETDKNVNKKKRGEKE